MADWQYYPRPAWAAMILPMFLIDSAVVCGFQSLLVVPNGHWDGIAMYKVALGRNGHSTKWPQFS